MSEQHGCHRRLIASGYVVQVERCVCGTLYLVLGPFTLRLQTTQFRALLLTLLEAQYVLEEPAEETPDVALNRGTLLGQKSTRGVS